MPSSAAASLQKDGYQYLLSEYVSIIVSAIVLLYMLIDLQNHPFRYIDLIYVLVFVYVIVRNFISAYDTKTRLSDSEEYITAGLVFVLLAFVSRINLLQKSVF